MADTDDDWRGWFARTGSGFETRPRDDNSQRSWGDGGTRQAGYPSLVSEAFASVASRGRGQVPKSMNGEQRKHYEVTKFHSTSSASDSNSASDGNRRARDNLEEKYRDSNNSMRCTTLMIKNVPRAYTEDALLLELETIVGKGTFDFFYMPWDTKRQSNFGCAFVNFLSPADALRCVSAFSTRKWCFVSTSKTCSVVPAHVQGLENNLEHYRDRAVCSPDNVHCPIVFKDGERVVFAEAVRQYCGPPKPDRDRVVATQDDGPWMKDFSPDHGSWIDTRSNAGTDEGSFSNTSCPEEFYNMFGDNSGLTGDWLEEPVTMPLRSDDSFTSNSSGSSMASGLSQVDQDIIDRFNKKFGYSSADHST